MILPMSRPSWNPLASLSASAGPPSLFAARVSAEGVVTSATPEPFEGFVPGLPVPPRLRAAVEGAGEGLTLLPTTPGSVALAVVRHASGTLDVLAARSAPTRLAHLVDAAPIGVLRLAPDGRIRYANAAAEAALGASSAALEGTPVWEHAAQPEDRWRLSEAVRLAPSGAQGAVPFRCALPHGGVRVLEAHVLPDPDGAFLSLVLLDLTAQSEVEAALEQSETLYATFLEQSPVGLVHLDTTGTVTFENLRFRAIVGATAEDAWIGQNVRALPGTDDVFAALVDQVLSGQAAQGYRVRYAPRAGEVRRLLVNGAPILHEDGALLGAVLMVHDETQERAHAAEAALRQQFAQAESVLRGQVLEGVSETAFLETVARVVTEALGARRTAAFLPLTLHPDTLTVRTSWGHATEAFEAEAFVPAAVPELAEAVAHRHVVTMVDESGQASEPGALVERVFVPFFEGDAFAGFVVADQTAPGAALVDELRARLLGDFAQTIGALWSNLRLANRFRFTVSAIDDALFTYSFTDARQRRFLFLTDQIERLTGYPAAHFLRHDGAFEAICASDEDRAALRAHTERLVRGEESAVVVAIRTASGQMRYLRERTSLTTDETSAFQLAGIFTDVTEQRAAEQALCATAEAEAQASRDKSAFIYTLSHELRTPLGALHGFADLLATELGEAATPEAREFAETIRDKARQTLALVNDLFDLAHLEQGDVALAAQAVPLDGVVAAAVEKARPGARSGVETEVHVAAPPPVALADPKRLAGVLDNLLSNAYKFTHEGRVRVRAWQAGERVAVRVEDTGVGMSEAFLARLFMPFVQEDQRLNRDYNGTGLGLALARRLAERMHGTLEVESVKDAGSAFTLWLPAA